VRFDIVVTKATQLIGPIKPDMRSVHNLRLAIGAKATWSLTDTDEGYHTETSEVPHHSLRPSLPSVPLVPLLAPPSLTTIITITSTHHNQNILLVHERGAVYVSGTYHPTSTDGYQLHIAHLVENSNTSTTR
jgi:hypothetical protein